MIGIAMVGLVANTLSVLLLHKDSHKSLNIKSVYLHLLGDALSSIGVIVGGIFIYFFNLNILDPILSIVIGIYILIEGFKILKKATLILIESAPEDINYNLLKKEIEKVEGVRNIHHIHIWSLTEKDIHFEAHLNMEDMKLSETENIYHQIEKILKNRFGFNHITIQFEHNWCKDESLIKKKNYIQDN